MTVSSPALDNSESDGQAGKTDGQAEKTDGQAEKTDEGLTAGAG